MPSGLLDEGLRDVSEHATAEDRTKYGPLLQSEPPVVMGLR